MVESPIAVDKKLVGQERGRQLSPDQPVF